jgi:hypothetical protein
MVAPELWPLCSGRSARTVHGSPRPSSGRPGGVTACRSLRDIALRITSLQQGSSSYISDDDHRPGPEADSSSSRNDDASALRAIRRTSGNNCSFWCTSAWTVGPVKMPTYVPHYAELQTPMASACRTDRGLLWQSYLLKFNTRSLGSPSHGSVRAPRLY